MEIGINQDIRKFKTKDIGNFSFQEAGWALLAVGLGYGSYALQKHFTGEYVQFLIVLPAIVPILFGFFKPFGLTFYQFLKTVFLERYLSPQTLKWESDFKFDPYEFGELYGEEYRLSEEEIQTLYFPVMENKEETKKTKKRAKSESQKGD